MKKIIIIDGGPRKTFNTASMLKKFAEEAKRKYRDEHWEQDLQNAFNASKKMAEKIL